MADKATVYIIEDDDAVRDSIHLLIETADLVARSFASAGSFLRAMPLLNNSCVLIAQNLPDMTGLVVLQDLRGRGVGAPAIIMTIGADPAISSAAVRFGALILEKPYRPRRLIDLIRTALDR